jgi:isopenicillin N synthase-like dioxygenase
MEFVAADRPIPSAARLVAQLEAVGHLRLPAGPELAAALTALWAAGERFYALPAAVKAAQTLAEEYDGYHDIGREFSRTPDRPDLAEAFWARAIYADRIDRFTRPEARALYAACQRAIVAFEALLAPVTAALALHYGGPDARTFGCTRAAHLQFNHYEPRAQTRELLQDPHEDGLYFTLWWADQPGLEIGPEHGPFVPPRLAPGEILAMPGEICTLLTGGRVPPLWHQVRNARVERRFSVMYFANPDPVRPLEPWARGPANEGVDILERAIRNPERYGLPALPVT